MKNNGRCNEFMFFVGRMVGRERAYGGDKLSKLEAARARRIFSHQLSSVSFHVNLGTCSPFASFPWNITVSTCINYLSLDFLQVP